MSGGGIRPSFMGGLSSAQDAGSGTGGEATIEQSNSVRRSRRIGVPSHGIPQREAGHNSVTQIASEPPRTSLPQRDAPTLPPRQPMSVADRERLAKLIALGDRVIRTSNLLQVSTDSRQRRQLLLAGYKDFKEILSIYEGLSPFVRAQEKPLSSALDFVKDLMSMVEKDLVMSLLQDISQILPNDSRVVQDPLRVTNRLTEVADQSREVQDYKQFMQGLMKLPEVRGCPQGPGSIREQVELGITKTLILACLAASGALLLQYKRLKTYEIPAALREALDEIAEVLRSATQRADPLLETGPEAVEEGNRKSREHLRSLVKLGRAADRFAQAAAENWSAEEGESDIWEHSLELADALSNFTSAIIESVEHEARVRAAVLAEPHGTDEASTSSAPAPSTTEASPDSSTRTRRSRRSRANRRQAAVNLEAPTALATTHPSELALKRANGLLRSHPLTRQMVQCSNADVLSLARQSGKDVGALEAMISGEHEPHAVAHMARESVRSWFGDVKPLQQARDEMRTLLQTGEADDGIQACIDQLSERIEALDLLSRRIDANEANALKRHEFPRAHHLQRMLELGEIDGIAAPFKLDSAGDEGNLGTLFELQIQPKALADGNHAEPFFLHMHASRLMSVEQAMTLPFDQFTAVHVKTRKQKNLGARWEEIQQRLGNLDAHVHRGKVDPALLNQLRRMASGPANLR